MSTLTYLGHACFLFETEQAACLIDPWLAPSGAFLGAWRQLPPNDHKLGWLVEKLKSKPVMIYVTHEHEDHYDETTLRQLLPHAKQFCIPRYENAFLRNLIGKNLGVEPTLLDENNWQKFHDIEFKIFMDESGINRDSAIFLRSDGFSFFDGNDCKIFDRAAWLAEQCGPIGVMSSQFSGANMHPICYEMTADEYKRVSHQKKMRKYVACRDFIRALNPRLFVPSAGPAMFAYPEHVHLNFEETSIFPKWWDFQAWLGKKDDGINFVPLGVGGSIVGDGRSEPKASGVARKLSDDDIRGFIDYYRRIDAAAPAASAIPATKVLAFFEAEMKRKIAVLHNYPHVRLACPLYVEISMGDGGKRLYCIHPERLELETVQPGDVAAPYYFHATSVDALGRLMQSGKGWGTYFLSFLFRNRRDPDSFDSALSTFFVANDDADLDFGLKKLAGFRESSEYITLTAPDGKATVSCRRFCPHQGADLKYAAFDGRYVTCPRHQWRFDCAHGGKADTSDDTIDATITNKSVA
jgi:UDP-MurNAc hydroxylase